VSEKRFILAYEKGNEAIFEDNNHIFPKRMTNKEVEKMLNSLNEENKQLLYKLQQIEEYLQIKIDECKNHKKMKEIVFGVEQQVGYEKALLGFQKGLKRRVNDE